MTNERDRVGAVVVGSVSCEHEPDDGCWRCCPRCSVDDHRCPGCGEPLEHKVSVCAECVTL